MSTIFAQSSAYGRAGVAVFRISGPNTTSVLTSLGIDALNLEPRKLYLRKIYHPHTKIQIDEGMVVFFQGNASFTGEDSAELHLHGSLAVIQLLYKACASLNNIRFAEAGEFAKRAFLNGKMDLTSAEGLADLIDADTEMQHNQAIQQLSGELGKIYDKWRNQLLQLMGLLEAYIDFPEEEIPTEILMQSEQIVKQLMSEISNHLHDNNRGERLRYGVKMAILGKPNVGKSSLINHLIQRNISIVSQIAGTTRDVIEGNLDIGGYPIIIQDTAGIHEGSEDLIEQEGIKKAREVANSADIKIIIYDASIIMHNNSLNENEKYFDEIVDDNTIIILNKIDLCTEELLKLCRCNVDFKENRHILVSIKKQQGFKQLLDQIIAIAERITKPRAGPQITRIRHRIQLKKAFEYLSNFVSNDDLILRAEDIRMTIRALGNITGQITVDEILGEIFSNFCIGK